MTLGGTRSLDDFYRVLAHHYGSTEETRDFIISYDINYRIVRDADGQDK